MQTLYAQTQINAIFNQICFLIHSFDIFKISIKLIFIVYKF